MCWKVRFRKQSVFLKNGCPKEAKTRNQQDPGQQKPDQQDQGSGEQNDPFLIRTMQAEYIMEERLYLVEVRQRQECHVLSCPDLIQIRQGFLREVTLI